MEAVRAIGIALLAAAAAVAQVSSVPAASGSGGGGAPSGSAGGDLGSTYPNPTVVQLNGAAVPASAAVLGTNSSRQGIAATAAGVAGLFSGSCAVSPCALGSNGALYQTNGATITSSGIGYLFNMGVPTAMTGVAPTTNRVYVYQFVPDKSITLTKGTFYLNVGAAGGARFAILDSSLAFLVTSTVNTTLSGNSSQQVTFASTTLYAGTTYYLAFTADNSSISIYVYGFSALLGGGLNTSGSRIGYCANASTGSGGSLAFPASCGAVTTSTTLLPVVMMFES